MKNCEFRIQKGWAGFLNSAFSILNFAEGDEMAEREGFEPSIPVKV
jgi:hypothetical protein